MMIHKTVDQLVECTSTTGLYSRLHSTAYIWLA